MFAAKFDSLGNNVWLKQGENQYGHFQQKPEIDHQGNIYLFGIMSAVGNPAGTATFNGYTASNAITTNFTFYPNPMVDELTVEATESLFYPLYDLTGKTLKKGTLNIGRNTIDITQLSGGLYMLQLQNAKGAQRVVRLVKE